MSTVKDMQEIIDILQDVICKTGLMDIKFKFEIKQLETENRELRRRLESLGQVDARGGCDEF